LDLTRANAAELPSAEGWINVQPHVAFDQDGGVGSVDLPVAPLLSVLLKRHPNACRVDVDTSDKVALHGFEPVVGIRFALECPGTLHACRVTESGAPIHRAKIPVSAAPTTFLNVSHGTYIPFPRVGDGCCGCSFDGPNEAGRPRVVGGSSPKSWRALETHFAIVDLLAGKRSRISL
jgi:hypothetical protein